MNKPTVEQINEWGQAFEENRLLVVPDKNIGIEITIYAKILKGEFFYGKDGYCKLSVGLSSTSNLNEMKNFVKGIRQKFAQIAVANLADVILISREEHEKNKQEDDCDKYCP